MKRHQQHVAPFVSEHAKAAAMLIRCEHCGIEGPKARYPEHVQVNHQGQPPPAPYIIAVPGRFRQVLERLAQDAHAHGIDRTPSQMIAAALDDWLLGRRPVGFRSRAHTHWGQTA